VQFEKAASCIFCSDAMHKCSLCHHTVSVRLSRSFILSKRVYIYFKFFSPSGFSSTKVFLYQMLWQYFDGDPLTGAKIAIFDQYLALRWPPLNHRVS